MSKSRPPFLIGADPELFMKTQQGKLLSAIGKLGGTKDKPMPVETLGKGYAYQEDNVLVEYNIPACRNVLEFIQANKNMMDFLSAKVRREHNAKLAIEASNIMPDDQLTDPRAHVFGCDPDFNVWTLENNPRPRATNPALRSAGGHIHIGLKMGKMDAIMLGRLLDTTIGLWSVTVDKDTRRRELYGKAGAIRFKKYGLEYRTLSNFWLKNTDYQQMLYSYVNDAITKFSNRQFGFIEKHGAKIFETINNSDAAEANTLLKDAVA